MDPSLNLAEATQNLGFFATLANVAAVEFLPRLAAAVGVFVLGYLVAGWIGRLITRVLNRPARLEPTLVPVIGAAVRYALMIFVLVAALSQLGVQTTSILTALGAAGLAIGLALQGTLQNIAAGIMLLWLRPFHATDSIETTAVAGTVEEVGLFATQLRTSDGIYKFVPNSELWNKILTNYDRNPTRMITLDFTVSYDNDIAECRRVLREAADGHPKVLRAPGVQAVPVSFSDSVVVVQLRAWAANADFFATKWDLTEAGKRALDRAGIAVSSPRAVRLVNDGGGPPARAA
jgi:small conductance mechanosensitive channel